MTPSRILRLTAASVLFAAGLAAQEQDEPPFASPEPPQGRVTAHQGFFAGQVTSLDPEHITVSRTLVGRSPESRTFSISKKTKLSKSVRVKSRVTVRFRHESDEDMALEIQVHTQPRSTHSTG